MRFNIFPSFPVKCIASIEAKGIRFLLIGSSARKITREGVNLLGGRAGITHMAPLTWAEAHDVDYTLDHIFNSGLLPGIYLSENPSDELDNYVSAYFFDEVQSEGALKNLRAFGEFLSLASASNGELLNYSNISGDVGISKPVIREWFQILTDTFLGSSLAPYMKTKKRKPIETSKYYLFDAGVMRALRGIDPPGPGSKDYGIFMETFIVNEVKTYLEYSMLNRKYPLTFWRSKNGQEVDLIIGDKAAIEIKSAERLSRSDFRGLKALREEGLIERYSRLPRRVSAPC